MSTTPLFGWHGYGPAQNAYMLFGDQFTQFQIANQTKDNSGKRVVLWDAAKKVNGGQHLPCFKQLIGDCVANGAARTVDYLYCTDIIFRQKREQFRPSYRPYIYGISKVQIGGQRSYQDGSLGIWAAQGLQKYGTLFADYDGVPAYSANVAKQWGHDGPAQNFITFAQGFPVKTTAKVDSYAKVRDAICNFYPVTVASDRGFGMHPQLVNGKYWGQAQGEWQHQMLFCALDDDPKRPGCYLMNSWGENAFYDPSTVTDGSPPGGFWVDAEVVDYMVGPNNSDSWAFSDLVGFPERDLNWLLI